LPYLREKKKEETIYISSIARERRGVRGYYLLLARRKKASPDIAGKERVAVISTPIRGEKKKKGNRTRLF